mmetsp:Transcript_111993/g.321824  ORF Transcript_111993/g.321824 Transcript_111993/m.321824 type:complete len:503 (+) Transcript_111993:117-1625(+)
MIGRRGAIGNAPVGIERRKRKWRLDLEDDSESSEGKPRIHDRDLRRTRVEAVSSGGGAHATSTGYFGADANDVVSPKPAGLECVQSPTGVCGDGPSRDVAAEMSDANRSKRQKKAFAWMDSGDEGGSDGSAEEECGVGLDVGAEEPVAPLLAHGQVRPCENDDESGAESNAGNRLMEEDPLSQLDNVKTFAQFMRLSPKLQILAAVMAPQHFVTLCRIAARVKYFDKDVFTEVFKHLTPQIKDNAFSTEQLKDVVTCLIELNACDGSLLAAVSTSVMPRIAEIDKSTRREWLTLLAEVKSPNCEVLVSALKNAPNTEEQTGSSPISTRLPCRHFARGFCSLGKSCTFSHDGVFVPQNNSNQVVLTQMQQTTSVQGGFGSMGGLQNAPPVNRAYLASCGKQVCRHFLKGYCSMGSVCSFRHVQAVAAASGGGAVGGICKATAAPVVVRPPVRLPVRPPEALRPRFPMPARTTSKVCIHFSSGSCKWGAKCHFLHAVTPQLPSP